jgi:AAHS family 4-hydroxybenzoate transporter-like MFS transporter
MYKLQIGSGVVSNNGLILGLSWFWGRKRVRSFLNLRKARMKTRTTIDVGALIENSRLGWFHMAILFNTCMVMFIEGYDMQVTSYAAPAIIKAWHLTNAYFGPVFGFGLFGYLLGGTVLGHLGDRLGRKKVIIGGPFLFGIFTFAAAYTTSLTGLLILRFLAGIGIGASIPAAIALTVEYAPGHWKARIISLLFLGYTLGGTLGGFVAARLIPVFGWPSVFKLGGIAPIILAAFVALTLPESVRFLALRQDRPDQVRAILQKLSPEVNVDENADYVVAEERHRGLPVKHLFTEGRGTMTVLLWIAFASSLLGHYFLTSWLPTILAGAAIPLTYAIISGALLQGGGGIGGLLICWLSDKKSMLFIALAFCLASPLIILIPRVRGSSLLMLAFMVGFFLVGGQIGLNSIAGTIYPTDIRSTGAGWALGIGRIGSILGPVLGGVLISAHLPIRSLFVYTALVVLLCAITILILSKITRTRKTFGQSAEIVVNIEQSELGNSSLTR